MGERPTGDLIASVLRGLHYEVRPDAVIRWWEPGTTKAPEEGWFMETLFADSEIPLADVCSLSVHVGDRWRAFMGGDPILTGIVEYELSPTPPGGAE